MRNLLTLLLASFGLMACAPTAHSPRDKEIVTGPSLYRLKTVHRHDDYSGGYYYEEDRYARLTRWRDPVVILPRPIPAEPGKAVAAAPAR